MRVTINLEGDKSIKEIVACCHTSLAFEKPHAVTIAPTKKDRSTQQNSISHVWYSQVRDTEKEYTEDEVKCLCKLHIAIPILRGSNEEFNAMVIAMIEPLPYEMKVRAMQFFPVTSLMDTKQMSLFLTGVQRNYAGRVDLRFPSDYKN